MQIVDTLRYIKNKANCSHTLPRARLAFAKIRHSLEPAEAEILANYLAKIDIENPDVWVPEWQRKNADYKRSLCFDRKQFHTFMDKLILRYMNEKR